MTILDVLSRFQKVKNRGNGAYTALCPVHDDHRPSLSITDKGDRILIHCHAGCDTEDVLGCVGLTMSDLFTESNAPPPSSTRQPAAVYNYHSANGAVIARKQRYADKSFRWQRPDGSGGWIVGLEGTRIPVYNLPAVLAAPVVYLVEGEKDADNLNRLGLAATTAPNGASWKPEYTDRFKGKTVIILPDNDEPGRIYAREAADSLLSVAAGVKLLDLKKLLPDLPDKGDISDILDARRDDTGVLAELVALAGDTPSYRATPSAKTIPNRIESSKRRLPNVIHLGEVSDEPPKYLIDPYIPLERLTLLCGSAGIGKTHWILNIIAQLSTGRQLFGDAECEPVVCLYCTIENDSPWITKRLRDMEANLDCVKMVDESFSLEDEVLEELIVQYGAGLVVLDPLHSYLGRANMNRADQIRPLLDMLTTMCRRTGCTMVFIEHPTKARKNVPPLDRINGTSDLRNCARSILLLGHDTSEPDVRVLVHAKHSMGELGPSIRYHIGAHGIALDGFCDTALDEFLYDVRKEPSKKVTSKLEEAKRLLTGLFAEMPYIPYDKVRDALKADSISLTTAYRAKDELGVGDHHEGFPRRAWWIAPGADKDDVITQIHGDEAEPSGNR